MEWQDQYKHPNWQKKRLDALNAHGFSCQRCESKDKSLHVHHKIYIKGRKLWEYSIDELEVLCGDCHKDVHKEKDVFNEVMLCSGVSFMSCAALLVDFVCGLSHPEDEIYNGLCYFNPSLVKIGNFARNEVDYESSDIHTILSLNPDEFHEVAEYVRNKNGSN